MSRLLLTTTNGDDLSVDGVKPGDTIASVKAKIQVMMGIPVNQQNILVNDSELDDAYELPTFANFAELLLETFIDIEIRKLNGESFTLKVETHEIIWNVKCKIEIEERIRPDQQRLVVDQTDTVLHNDKTLSHYSIQNRSVLHLIQTRPDPDETWRYS
jgi:hypothetical protein